MNLSEKAQYLSGLMDGLNIDESTDTGKVLTVMKDLLTELCETVDGIDSDVDDIVDFCNAIDEDLHEVESLVLDEEPDEPPHCCHHKHPHPMHPPYPPKPFGNPHHHHCGCCGEDEDDDEEYEDDGWLYPEFDSDLEYADDMSDSEDEENEEDLHSLDGE